jgi:hypothetical protein
MAVPVAEKQKGGMEMKAKLSTLWIVIMFNMAYADIISIMDPSSPIRRIMAGGPFLFRVSPGFLLASAVAMELTIVMIILSRVLKHKANRLANIAVGSFDFLVTVFLLHRAPYYMFFSAVELVCLALIIGNALKWRASEAEV